MSLRAMHITHEVAELPDAVPHPGWTANRHTVIVNVTHGAGMVGVDSR